MNPRVGWNGLISNATNGLGALLVDATTRQIILRTPTGSVTIFVSWVVQLPGLLWIILDGFLVVSLSRGGNYFAAEKRYDLAWF
jgi:hypothetical protein